MASPDVFLSSPSRGSRHCIIPSSSPDLPSIQDLLPQKASRPTIESRNKTTTIPDTKNSTFSGVRDLWKSAQAATVNQINALPASNPFIVIEDNDSATTIIEPAPNNKTPPRRRRRSNEKLEAIRQHPTHQERQIEEVLETTQQPWKRFISKSPGKDGAEASAKSGPFREKSTSPVPVTAPAHDVKRTSSPMQDSLLAAQPRTRPWDTQDSLQLEPAMTRRKDWTPPKQTATCDGSPESSAATGSVEPGDGGAKRTSFETLLTAYKCRDSANDDGAPHQSDGSASKKRRLAGVQPVQTTLAPPIPIASTVGAKKKAPRKKPRTITSLALAAYKQATQVDCGDASACETNSVPLPHPQQAAVQNKAKEKPPKRPTKAKKKRKILPPKPVLFSPETALKQVAQQDFVFGTSSQLAEEQSPTFLRDLQRAMKSSNQLDEVLYSTPLNSDSAEPLEYRPKLWDAAARDADGDLFDVEVINLTEDDACAPPTPGEDPFGYCKGDTGPSPQLPRAAQPAIDEPARDDDGFVDLSDVLQASPKALVPEPETSGISCFSSCPPSPQCQNEPHSAFPVLSKEDLETGMSPQPRSVVQTSAMPVSVPVASHVTRSAFENYTDAQLSSEVSRYGFKPIKRRSAMVALLEQCWQERMDHIGPQARMLSTGASASKPPVSSPTKRPRGRPRQDSGSMEICQPQEPPPSAQVPETPKPRRGRLRKDAETSPSIAKVPKKKTQSKQKATPEKTTPKKTSPKKTSPKKTSPKKTSPKKTSPKRATPKKKAKTDSKVFEIADSESELSYILGTSPSPSSGTESESNLFEFVTRAITTAPRTTVPSEPSWHEKILLYDPIVLEDLTSWLNSGQLTRVGCDEEINPAEVKKWCESKSICCLWKMNLRGRERKGF
ncbi:hypothetical protein E4U42_006740 [Claviceps africana]|uniref:Structure-specific endonuclease subunit SLX4 n=1 Tax=Claviceps africana TaxID=83212 RepID=A0A8K0NGL7_9HYPO|nr:hypothetical protein E4U42_006740 [Claviceps africana]